MHWLILKFMAVTTNVLPQEIGNNPETAIDGILKLVLDILLYGVGAAAVLGVVIAGVMYLTARDSEAQVATAKKRLYEVVLGLVLWVAMFTLLKWLIPGW